MKKTAFIILSLALLTGHGYAQTTKKKTSKTKKTTSTSTSSTNKSTSLVNLPTSLSSLTEVDVSKGLKEALTVGAKNAATTLNQANGYFGNPEVKIPFPQEVIQVSSKLRALGMGKQVDEFEKTMNQAAEQAAVEAAPIFVNAITQMTITDAKNILTGNKNSATVFLQDKCTSQLTAAFSPHVKKSLDNTLATSYWKDITSYYNKLPFVTPVNTDLVQYTTGKALEGLFKIVGKEETKIRDNPSLWSTNVLQQVFGAK
jgi:hypothetical protein